MDTLDPHTFEYVFSEPIVITRFTFNLNFIYNRLSDEEIEAREGRYIDNLQYTYIVKRDDLNNNMNNIHIDRLFCSI